MISIATWNVNSITKRSSHISQWLVEHSPDVIAFQETKIQDNNFPCQLFTEIGYNVVYTGQKSYNGVAIASRKEACDVTIDLPGMVDEQRRFIAATIGSVRVLNIYVPNGQSVDSDKYAYKLKWLEAFTECVVHQLKTYEQLVIVGDFNIAPEDRDVHDPIIWEGQVMVSEGERNALKKLVGNGLIDVFRLFEKGTGFYTWWDYRMLGFPLNRGLRIDYILASQRLSELTISCQIDRLPRKWKQPSDHVPVIAKFDIP